jgi:hypothetical protein
LTDEGDSVFLVTTRRKFNSADGRSSCLGIQDVIDRQDQYSFVSDLDTESAALRRDSGNRERQFLSLGVPRVRGRRLWARRVATTRSRDAGRGLNPAWLVRKRNKH